MRGSQGGNNRFSEGLILELSQGQRQDRNSKSVKVFARKSVKFRIYCTRSNFVNLWNSTRHFRRSQIGTRSPKT
jgi:hypothetical protein